MTGMEEESGCSGGAGEKLRQRNSSNIGLSVF